MKAIHNHTIKGSAEQLVYEDTPQPMPQAGEVLVRVHAAGITPAEFGWTTNWQLPNGQPRSQPIIPGHEYSGVVAALGDNVTGVSVGESVYGLIDFYRDGAMADYAIALPSEFAPKPQSLDHIQAAAVPLSALTAWQALVDHAQLSAGQTILIHAASGGVGIYAVQLARWIGAHVIATASAASTDFVRSLGADELIDYHTTRFETVAHNVDVVLDCIGGDTQERSWGVLKKGGLLIAITGRTPSQERAAAEGVRALFFIVEPHREQFVEIGSLIDAGHLRPIVERVFPLSEARQAFQRPPGSSTQGKTVLRVMG